MHEPTDRELLHRLKQGDPVAFAALIRRHDRHLYRLARSMLRDDDEAEDVVQETYVRAFTGLVDFRGEAGLRTWLTRIAINETIRRKRRERSTVDLDEFHASEERNPRKDRGRLLTASDSDPERATAQTEIRKVLEQAIDDLPPAFRTVFVMRDVEEATVEQTADQLETVRTRLHRARRMLRESLGEQVAAALKDVFPFDRPRCDELIARLRDRLGFRAAMPLALEDADADGRLG